MASLIETGIRTARWRVTRSHAGSQPYTSVTLEWIRLDPPARAWRNDHGDCWSYDVLDARGHLHTASTWTNSICMPVHSAITAEWLLSEVLLPPPGAPSESGSDRAGADARSTSSRTELDGRPAIVLEWSSVERHYRATYRLWHEPDSGRYIRMERAVVDLRTGETAETELRDLYEYNVDLPPETFEMPADKPLQEPPIPAGASKPEIWDQLAHTEQQAIRDTIALSDSGWLAGNFRRFSSAWEFDRIRYLPSKKEWQTLVAANAGLWREWSSNVQSAMQMDSIGVPLSTNAWSMVPAGEPLIRAMVKLHAVWADDGSSWEGRAEFYLRRTRRGFHIVHWEPPLEEIKAAHAEI